MSTLKVTNIQATGETASRAVSGVAAASLNYKGTATNSIRYSFNVSSVTDNTTGDYTNNFTNSMSSADYTVTCAQGGDGNANEVRVPKIGGSLAASNYSYNTLEVTVAIRDVVYIFHTIHGDLA
jgi:hypothetical protein